MSDRIVGRDGPVLLVSERDARVLWPAVRAWVDERARVGALAQVRAVAETLADWELLANDGRARSPVGPDGVADGVRSAPMTTREVASRLHFTTGHVRRLCARGVLDACRVGRDWQISPASVHTLEGTR